MVSCREEGSGSRPSYGVSLRASGAGYSMERTSASCSPADHVSHDLRHDCNLVVEDVPDGFGRVDRCCGVGVRRGNREVRVKKRLWYLRHVAVLVCDEILQSKSLVKEPVGRKVEGELKSRRYGWARVEVEGVGLVVGERFIPIMECECDQGCVWAAVQSDGPECDAVESAEGCGEREVAEVCDMSWVGWRCEVGIGRSLESRSRGFCLGFMLGTLFEQEFFLFSSENVVAIYSGRLVDETMSGRAN